MGDDVAIDARTLTPLELQIPADERAPGRVRAELTRWLAARRWPDEDGEDLVYAVSEAVSNAAEHAYRGGALAQGPRPLVAVTVTELIDADRRRAKAVVDDFGVWRPVPQSRGNRGLGLRLIGTLVESYRVEHGRAGTRVTMISRSVACAGRTPLAGPFEARLRWLEFVADAGLAQLSVDQLLEEMLDKVRQLMAVDTAAVLLLDPSHRFLIATVARGIEEEVHQGVRIPLGLGFAGRIAQERHWVAIAQVDHDNVLNPILREKGIASLLGVPLVAGGRLLGVLHVGTLTPRRFTEQDADLLQMAADRAAIATQSGMSQAERAAAT